MHKPYCSSLHLLHPSMTPSLRSVSQPPTLAPESPGRKGHPTPETWGWIRTFLPHSTSSELRDPIPSPMPVLCCLQTSQWLSWLNHHPCLFPALTPPLNPKPARELVMSRHQAPQTQPIQTNPPPGCSSVPWLSERPHPSPSCCPAPQPQTQVAIHVSSCLPAISTCMSNGHLQCPNRTPHPQAAPPSLPSSAHGSLILPASQSKPLEPSLGPLSPSTPHTHPSTVPLSSASGTYLDVLKYSW